LISIGELSGEHFRFFPDDADDDCGEASAATGELSGAALPLDLRTERAPDFGAFFARSSSLSESKLITSLLADCMTRICWAARLAAAEDGGPGGRTFLMSLCIDCIATLTAVGLGLAPPLTMRADPTATLPGARGGPVGLGADVPPTPR